MERRSSIIGGAILILVGAIFLLLQLFPNVAARIDFDQQWPLIVVAIGILFLLSAILGTPPLAIPGSVVTGIGLMLYYQNWSDNWASWAFSWTLIPGFVGVGLILMGILSRQHRKTIREGGRLILISAALFVIFGAFFNGLGGIGQFWPVVLILAGVWLLWRNRRRSSGPKAPK